MNPFPLPNRFSTGSHHPRYAGTDRRMKPGCPSGFSVLEVLVAIFVFLVSLMGLISVTVGVIHGNAFSMQITTATNLAQDEIENLKRKGYAHADLTAGAHSDPGNPISTMYTRTWSVVDNTPVADIKTLTVTITWDWRGVARNVQMVTFVAKR